MNHTTNVEIEPITGAALAGVVGGRCLATRHQLQRMQQLAVPRWVPGHRIRPGIAAQEVAAQARACRFNR